jgi:predicted alpha/beta hydrolase
MLRRERVELRTEDGWLLRGELVRPETPKGVAVLGHAMMVDRRTMDRRGEGLATTLAAAGIAALNVDLRGHGESGPSAREGARYGLDDFVRGDLPAMVRYARAAFPGLPVSVVGHSLAGTSALLAAGSAPTSAPDAIVTLAANMGLPRHEPSSLRLGLKIGAYLTWAALTLPRGLFDPRALRLGTDAEPWSYTGPYVRVGLGGAFQSRDGATDYLAAMAAVSIPVLVVASEGDRVLAPPDAVFRFADELRSARVEKRRLTGANAPSHMGIVTSAAARPHWEDVAAWLLATLGAE